MDATDLMRNRVAAVHSMLADFVGNNADLDWATPIVPGTSPIGLTLWHLPRVQDWVVNTCVRGTPELADDASYSGLPDPEVYGFGTGLTPEQASEAAAAVSTEQLLTYAAAVRGCVDEWLATLTPDDLDDPVPEFSDRQRSRAAYSTPEALAEVEGLIGVPLGLLIVRPAVAHCVMHLGEIDALAQVARAR